MGGLPLGSTHRLEKRAGMDNVFRKKLKFGQVIPVHQDKWAGSDTKKNRQVYPSARLV